MDAMKLGPNGGLVYCMEFLEKNFDWLLGKLEALRDAYLLIDCPGQGRVRERILVRAKGPLFWPILIAILYLLIGILRLS